MSRVTSQIETFTCSVYPDDCYILQDAMNYLTTIEVGCIVTGIGCIVTEIGYIVIRCVIIKLKL
jgi:hypothetical protein